jgi:predicted 3-demethylubiquinone-9 3-methyltransferase (glyoxalase superfamily)
MQKITPFLWFDDKAEEAVNFYASVFKNSKIKEATRYDEAGAKVSGKPAGSVMTVSFELEGQEFTAINGGPGFPFSQAISFVVNCESQEEVDNLWNKLTQDGGKEIQCGWLTDKYGIPWQIIPTILPKLLSDPNPKKAQRVMQAMLKMKKIEIEKLKEAAEQE